MTPIDIDIPELAVLTLKGLIALTVIVGLIDTVYAVLLAIAQGVFNAAYLPAFLINHAAKVWGPIVFLGLLGNGVATLDVPAIHVAFLAAEVGLGAYVVAVIKSLAVNTVRSNAPATVGSPE